MYCVLFLCTSYRFVLCVLFVFFFFFKQKTAYELRISDWSSDVCSSDLGHPRWMTPQVESVLGFVDVGRLGWHVVAHIVPWKLPRDNVYAAQVNSRKPNRAAICAAGGFGRSRLLPASSKERPRAMSSPRRSEEHTSEIPSLMRIPYAVFCLK